MLAYGFLFKISSKSLTFTDFYILDEKGLYCNNLTTNFSDYFEDIIYRHFLC